MNNIWEDILHLFMAVFSRSVHAACVPVTEIYESKEIHEKTSVCSLKLIQNLDILPQGKFLNMFEK